MTTDVVMYVKMRWVTVEATLRGITGNLRFVIPSAVTNKSDSRYGCVAVAKLLFLTFVGEFARLKRIALLLLLPKALEDGPAQSPDGANVSLLMILLPSMYC